MPMKRMTIVAIVVLVVAIVLIGSSAAVLVLTKNHDKGTVTMYVKDLPATWAHVNVTFSTVQIHSANDSVGWKNLTLSGSHTIDLAALVNVSALLAEGSVPAGNYTQIRIVVTNATGVMTGGTAVNFTVPSGVLRTTHPFTVTAGDTTKLTLDINLNIVQAGDKWMFTPVIGAVVNG